MPETTGRPCYAPGDPLKLYIYLYLNRMRSDIPFICSEWRCHKGGGIVAPK